jgi:hypothetical protein
MVMGAGLLGIGLPVRGGIGERWHGLGGSFRL